MRRPEPSGGRRAGERCLELERDRDELLEELRGGRREEMKEPQDGARDLDLVARVEGLCRLCERLGISPPPEMFDELFAEGEIEKGGEQREEPREAFEQWHAQLAVVGQVEKDGTQR